METQHTLSAVIREALADRDITTLRAAAEATGLDKDAIARRYRGEVAWTWPDLDKIATFLGCEISDIATRAEERAA